MRVSRLFALLSVLAVTPAAHAGFILTVAPSGSNVVASGTGTLDLTGLSGPGFDNAGADVYYQSLTEWIFSGPTSMSIVAQWTTDTAPSGFVNPSSTFPGSLGHRPASSGSGTLVGAAYESGGGYILLPFSYSGGSISSTATWNNTTIAGLGLNPGTYDWTWSNDFFRIVIQADAAGVPEPSTMVLVGGALLVVAFRRRGR